MERDLSKYVRVSQILSIFGAYAYVPADKLKKAQDIGRDVHEAIEKYFQDEFCPLDWRKRPYFESFLIWADNIHPKPLLIENRLFDDVLKITGQIDLIADIGGDPVLVDFKTGKPNLEIWELQLHWYFHLLELNKCPFLPKEFMVVNLSKNAEAPTIYSFPFNIDALKTCFHALECWKFFNRGLY